MKLGAYPLLAWPFVLVGACFCLVACVLIGIGETIWMASDWITARDDASRVAPVLAVDFSRSYPNNETRTDTELSDAPT